MSTTVGGAGEVHNRHNPLRGFFARLGPGVLLSLAVALPAYELASLTSSLDPLATSLILGVVIGNVLGPSAAVQPGIRFTSALFIPLGIILYGTRLHFETFSQLPALASLGIVTGMATFYLVILLGTRILGINRSTGLLIASGSAICGASAIAVLAPIVGARSRETSMALIVITTAGLIGAVLYPTVADFLSMSSVTYGFFCGSTLQQIGIVKLAASHMGREVQTVAVTVKMLRIAMLAPIAIGLASYASLTGAGGPETTRAAAALSGETSKTERRERAWRLALKRAWFVPVFVAVAVIGSLAKPAIDLNKAVGPAATICLSLALASIGLKVDFQSIKSAGSKPLLLGIAGWAAAAAIFLFVTMPLFSLGG